MGTMWKTSFGVVWYMLALSAVIGQNSIDSPTDRSGTDATDKSTNPLPPQTPLDIKSAETSVDESFGELGRKLNQALDAMKDASKAGLPSEIGVAINKTVAPATEMTESNQQNQDIKANRKINADMAKSGAVNISNPPSEIQTIHTISQSSALGVSAQTGTASTSSSTTMLDTTVETSSLDISTTALENDTTTTPMANTTTSVAPSTASLSSDVNTPTAGSMTTADPSSDSSTSPVSTTDSASPISTATAKTSTSESSTSTDGPSVNSSPVSSTSSVTSSAGASASSSAESMISSSLSSTESSTDSTSTPSAIVSSSVDGTSGVSLVVTETSTDPSETTVESFTGLVAMSSSTDAPTTNSSNTVEPKSSCHSIPCINKCALGYELDENGCQTCKCKVHRCQSGRLYTEETAKFCGQGTRFCPGALICEQTELGSKGICCPSPYLVDCPPPRPGSRLLCLVQQRYQCRSHIECGPGRRCCPGTCGNTCRRLSRAGRSRLLSINGL